MILLDGESLNWNPSFAWPVAVRGPSRLLVEDWRSATLLFTESTPAAGN
jgi:hypothetical protein